LYLRGAEREECCEDGPLDGDFKSELGSEVRSVSIIGAFGLLDGFEFRDIDIADGDRDLGKDDREVLRGPPRRPPLLELVVNVKSVVPLVIVGRCMAALVASVS
jgi:hypothetical protein